MEIRDNDRLDQWLDRALRQGADVQPRMGLEERLLATIRNQAGRRGIVWLRWPAVAAVTISLVVVMWMAFGDRSNSRGRGSANNGQREGVTAVDHKRDAPIQPYIRHVPPHLTKHTHAKPPRLEQFPSPRPLSAEENMLATYAVQFQDEAVVIARLNNDVLQRDRAEFVGNPMEGSQALENTGQ